MIYQGTRSILNYFQTQNPCRSANQEHSTTIHEAKALSSLETQLVVNSSSEVMICENSPANNGSHIGTVSSYQNESRRNNWTYKIDEIDDAVLSELPAEIQEEPTSQQRGAAWSMAAAVWILFGLMGGVVPQSYESSPFILAFRRRQLNQGPSSWLTRFTSWSEFLIDRASFRLDVVIAQIALLGSLACRLGWAKPNWSQVEIG
ncbi:hypothetical protein M9H77_17085 [Catharanthus roseus]|uniref:Uncharacterized protein n=1 Tax=Catharanthus roseus TaxID=4058 RepID=A0ACC0B3L7_CATRO|nr:hypothetical protein M9H77_17085 [Catharanthus roseus]